MKTTTVARLTLVCASLIFISLLTGLENVYALENKDVVGMWLFEEGEGDVAKDSSGNGHDSNFVGDADWVEGKNDTALKVGGGSGVEVPHSDDLNLTTFTIQAWIKLNKGGEWQQVVTKGNSPLRNYSLNVSPDNVVEIAFTAGGQFVQPYPLSETSVVDGKWHHVAGTYDKENLRVYVDGALEAEEPHTETPDNNQNPLTFGKGPAGAVPTIDGFVDEVRICNIALTEDEIKESMGGIAAVEPACKLATVWSKVKTAY